ncbi:carboxypeptidase regulatory-like domain-containing protein [Ilyomonas limi]|uniref:Carboxypeptidase regulatory-like domain-containing protein n=1 Tax=Ilyomonas limi TaxID=2575867 RepID=A0A4U3L0J4_9BACT|nr:carboxypeptidase-like regulatory domain-containing protein [Ilyomonas limi]TKK66957.1 carboxypeptidase regulatory-like domain-containing protein [Ilyomonas limi]
MKTSMYLMMLLLLFSYSLPACKKDTHPPSSAGYVTGKVTDASGQPLPGVKVTIEHTVWANSYVFATTDNNGNYKVAIPAEPAGDWTAKAQIKKSAYGQDYTFDLAPGSTDAFTVNDAVTRNFTWKLSGEKPAAGTYYGAHVDLYQFGTDAPVDKIKLIFTPTESTLIDGSPATTIEKTVEDVAGTFMAKDIPIGKYTIKAVYPGKTLLLDNRHDDHDAPAVEQPVIFGKSGYLGETEYNVEFWLSE